MKSSGSNGEKTNKKRSVMQQAVKKPGRPRETRLSSQAKGLVASPVTDCCLYEEHSGNDKVVSELVFQFPLHLKCISNTIRQVDKNGKLHFIFLPDQVILSYGDNSMGAS
jgi:hypothetical protein